MTPLFLPLFVSPVFIFPLTFLFTSLLPLLQGVSISAAAPEAAIIPTENPVASHLVALRGAIDGGGAADAESLLRELDALRRACVKDEEARACAHR